MSTDSNDAAASGALPPQQRQVPNSLRDLTGKQLNNWDVLSYAGRRSGRHFWNCRCRCIPSTEMIVAHTALLTGVVTSCGKAEGHSGKARMSRKRQLAQVLAAKEALRIRTREKEDRRLGRQTTTYMGKTRSPKGIPYGLDFRDLTGRTFGELTVLKYVAFEPNPPGPPARYWACRCSCGGLTLGNSETHLHDGTDTSCGWCMK